MLRRHDSLLQMALTLFAALCCGLLLEAEGLHLWAERLEVGTLRQWAQPAAEAWQRTLAPWQADWPRKQALAAKETWSPYWLRKTQPSELLAKEPPAITEPSEQGLPKKQASMPATRQLAMAAATVPHLALDAGKALRIALAGDSMMAVGLAPTLMRGLAKERHLQIVRAYRSGTGLSRPEVFDWQVEYPRMLGAVEPEIVICAMGANDAQNVQVGKQVLAFYSPEWDAHYRQKLKHYLDMLSRKQARVLWVGMPLMKSARFAQKMIHMNQLARDVIKDYPNATWLDPNPALGYSDNTYGQYRPNAHGKLVRLRADDGIHLTDDGATYLLPAIHTWLRHQLKQPATVSG